MTATSPHLERPWVAPEACAQVSWIGSASSDLQRAIERTEEALMHGSLGKVIHSLLEVRASLRRRLDDADLQHGDCGSAPLGPCKRRLRRRYAASLCSVDRLLDEAWSVQDRDGLRMRLHQELGRIRRVESLEDRADLEQHWIDLGVGDRPDLIRAN